MQKLKSVRSSPNRKFYLIDLKTFTEQNRRGGFHVVKTVKFKMEMDVAISLAPCSALLRVSSLRGLGGTLKFQASTEKWRSATPGNPQRVGGSPGLLAHVTRGDDAG
ncbi:hypothetical protein U1Q18_030639 [Sarracenia purpurea var. burkii]